MERKIIVPRPDWQKKVEASGLIYHTAADNQPYWDESAYYALTAEEVDILEKATSDLWELFLKAGDHVIAQDRFADLGICPEVAELIRWAWEHEPPALYGRMDLAFNSLHPPKLLEFNADTPTALLEASVIQWEWLMDIDRKADQFNSLHEKLLAKWKDLIPHLDRVLYFTHAPDPAGEDMMTVTYLRDTAEQAGLNTALVLIGDIGWNEDAKQFRDLEDKVMTSIFKLYPWEWLVGEKWKSNLLQTYRRMQWIEPIWKMMWSNKGILPILWELFPDHPNLLPAYFDSPQGMPEYVRKPCLSREGANVLVHSRGHKEETGGSYNDQRFIYQQFFSLPDFDSHFPVFGSWLIDGEPAGVGIREAVGSMITNNTSRFVPHLFR